MVVMTVVYDCMIREVAGACISILTKMLGSG